MSKIYGAASSPVLEAKDSNVMAFPFPAAVALTAGTLVSLKADGSIEVATAAKRPLGLLRGDVGVGYLGSVIVGGLGKVNARAGVANISANIYVTQTSVGVDNVPVWTATVAGATAHGITLAPAAAGDRIPVLLLFQPTLIPA